MKTQIKNEAVPTALATLSCKESQILDCALKLLIENGDAGLTLRKIADCAGMRLSNVQYYFKSRDDVIAAMVACYFEECKKSLRTLTAQSQAQTRRERVQFLVRSGLAHGHEISDMCRAFREIWAISSRNPVIDQCMADYYRGLADVIADYILDGALTADGREKLKALLVPYFEGYSITALSLALGADEVENMLTDLALHILGEGA